MILLRLKNLSDDYSFSAYRLILLPMVREVPTDFPGLIGSADF